MPSSNLATTPRTYSPPSIPVSKPAIHLLQTSLDICLQTITNQNQELNQQPKPQPIKPEYISLYLHPSEQTIDRYLIGVNGRTTYSLDISLETWKNILEEILNLNHLTPQLEKIKTLHTPHPANIYPYIFSYYYYKIVGLTLDPLKPPFWDYLKNKK